MNELEEFEFRKRMEEERQKPPQSLVPAPEADKPSETDKMAGKAYTTLPDWAKSALRVGRAATGLGEMVAPAGYTDMMDTAVGRPNLMENAVGAVGPGAAFGKASKAIGMFRGGLSGGLGFAGGEVGGKIAQEQGINPAWGSVPGSLLFGSPAMIPGGSTPSQMAREAVKGIPAADMQAALAQERNFPGLLRPSQQFDNPNVQLPLRRLEADVLSSKADRGLLQGTYAIPGKARALQDQLANQFGPADLDLGNASAINQAMQAARDFPGTHANAQTSHLYQQLDSQRPQLSPQQYIALSKDLDNALSQAGYLPQSDAARGLKSALTKVTSGTGIAESDIVGLDKFTRELSAKIAAADKPTASSADTTRAVGFRQLKSMIDDAILNASPDLAAARSAQANIRATLSKEFDSTALGRAMAETHSANGPSTWKRLFGALDEQQSPQNITTARTVLNRQDPDAFGGLARAWIADKVQGAKGEPAAFADAMLNHPNTKSIITELARDQGLGPQQAAQAADGYMTALRALRATANPVATPGGNDLASLLHANPVGIVGRYLAGNELSQNAILLNRIRRASEEMQLKRLNEALTDPAPLRALAELGKQSTMSPRVASMTSALIGGTVGTGDLERKRNSPLPMQ